MIHSAENISAYAAALRWYLDAGADEALLHDAPDRTARAAAPVHVAAMPDDAPGPEMPLAPAQASRAPAAAPVRVAPRADLYEQAVSMAMAASTLGELRDAIAAFDGIALKRTATNLVFADGNPAAPVMLVGEAPGADEDRLGKPFVGESGHLLDKILSCIGLDRGAAELERSVYITNVLNWRPPGNRSPSPAEIELSLPFVERHIQLVKPKILILCGGVSAKALLGSGDSISRLRKGWHDYTPQTAAIKAGQGQAIPAIVTYHPSYLLKTPSQKRAVWTDMLEIQARMRREIAV